MGKNYLIRPRAKVVMESGKKKQCEKWVETDSKVKFNSVNDFRGGLLEYFMKRKFSNSSKSESCHGKWQQEASDCVLWFLGFVFYPKIVLKYIHFGVPLWKVGRNILGG